MAVLRSGWIIQRDKADLPGFYLHMMGLFRSFEYELFLSRGI